MHSAPSVMFYVQHLFGIGHVFRASRIAKALAAAGCDTHLIWGGTDVPNLSFDDVSVHKLVPVRSRDERFSELIHADGRIFDPEDQRARRDRLLALFEQIGPDILITEAYPFGRRQMRFELDPLVDAATSAVKRPLIVSSIRDIMQENRKHKRVRETLDIVLDAYDLVLVHGDPQFVEIAESLQGASEIISKLRYTGIVAPPPPSADVAVPECNVLVSSGGGATGFQLLEVAMKAMPLSVKYPTGWRFVAGTEMPMERFRRLEEQCPNHSSLSRFVPDMVSAMLGAKVSVSRSGYNTVADIFRAKCTSILVPFTGGRETEQLARAKLLHRRGIATWVDEDKITPELLASAVDQAERPNRLANDINLDGDRITAEILLREYRLR